MGINIRYNANNEYLKYYDEYDNLEEAIIIDPDAPYYYDEA